MRVTKLLMITVLALFAGNATASDFQPTLLKIMAEQIINYDFNGTSFDLPITISGTQAGVIFSVFTHDKAGYNGEVHNGYLGWHYINKIDTCI